MLETQFYAPHGRVKSTHHPEEPRQVKMATRNTDLNHGRSDEEDGPEGVGEEVHQTSTEV